MDRPKLPRNDPPAFYARIPVNRHMVKKNGRSVMFNRATNKPFIGKSAELTAAEKYLLVHLLQAKTQSKTNFPIMGSIHACFRFHFSDFYTAQGMKRKTLPDLSNLIQGPEDGLQDAGIIDDDWQIDCLDGSARLPGPENILEVWIWAL